MAVLVVKSWPGLVNTYRGWGPEPVNTNCGPRLGAKQRAGGWEIQRPAKNSWKTEIKLFP